MNERERERDRQTDRQTDRDRERESFLIYEINCIIIDHNHVLLYKCRVEDRKYLEQYNDYIMITFNRQVLIRTF